MTELDQVLPLVTPKILVLEKQGVGQWPSMTLEFALLAQRAEDVRNLVAWLRAFPLRDGNSAAHQIGEGRGYGQWLEDAANELEAMLNSKLRSKPMR